MKILAAIPYDQHSGQMRAYVVEITTNELHQIFNAQYGESLHRSLLQLRAGETVDLAGADEARKKLALVASASMETLRAILQATPALAKLLAQTAAITPPVDERAR